MVSIAFHPRTFRPQILKFMNSSGAVSDCYKIIPYLQPQLGAFVVPYIQVRDFLSASPGCLVATPATPCPLGETACGSTARWMQNSKIGTTLSVGTKSTSGSVATQSSSDYFNDVSAFFQVRARRRQIIPGGQAAASAWLYQPSHGRYRATLERKIRSRQPRRREKPRARAGQSNWVLAMAPRHAEAMYSSSCATCCLSTQLS